MEIVQFEDKSLAHYSYAIISSNEVVLVDPSRNPQPYYALAQKRNAKIVAVIETHPHADFVSSHLQIHQETGATLYTSRLVAAAYPHQAFDEGDKIAFGKAMLKALHTPGHSPDSISIVAIDEVGKPTAVFTGDTLFIGDCGRPDLREQAGNITAKREELALQMYHSLRDKLMTLPDDVIVYPAHGAGSLCGKGMSDQNSSTMGAEKISNWSLQDMTQQAFVKELLTDQPFIPKYFGYNVDVNKTGAENYSNAIAKVKRMNSNGDKDFGRTLNPGILIIDSRPQIQFKKSHYKNSINLMDDTKFETWLGSIVNPGEKFYLRAESDQVLTDLINRTAKIGYETQIELGFVTNDGEIKMDVFDNKLLEKDETAFTIIDIRNPAEVKNGKIFSTSINIPLYELRERTNEIPQNKPIVVHCAGGYRSAAGASIIKSKLNGLVEVYDLSEAVTQFKK